MSPVANVQVYDVDDRPHPVPFDADDPPNLGLPDGTPEDTEARIRQLDHEIAWRTQRVAEHQAAIEAQTRVRDALELYRRHRPYSRG